ncbi:bifunctional DNA primase/polymerase [Cryobacterium sp. TMS1-20-1]|uniref:bifunctional DNA primase/polymerase n=1 Tax=Cryobacterium sp. TMS1-20-1 TaxID=1259223 RepID=UPI0010698300|nr:bifunctional DNA primase/polymerase [Cryobacterium sp. TMS1-20-1]TFC74562.1 bifunctional DNA primase/polymerase [Cryobacterium sp. TMS1-20-1]
MDIAEVLMNSNRLTTRDAALVFARAGFPIFPCVRDGKRPLTAAGFIDASCDIDQVGAWWARWPGANIGMLTGSVSGVDVVDVDVAQTISGFDAFERASAAGLVDGDLARVRTPSGGMHVYFPASAAHPQRCWQSAAAHIDFRGNGGYVVVPPSTLMRQNGRVGYRLVTLSAAGSKPVDAAALRSLVDPHALRTASRPETAGVPESTRLAQWVGRLQEGERNSGLFWAACRLAEAGFTPAAVQAALAPAAQSAGLPETEITATIRSANRRSGEGPRDRPESQRRDRPYPGSGRGDGPWLA